jgi:hypothetical protein
VAVRAQGRSFEEIIGVMKSAGRLRGLLAARER